MTYQYCYFSFEGELDSVRLAVEEAVGVQLSERDSSYWGGTYFLFKDNAADLRLKLHRNIDHTGEWIDSEFPGSLLLCSLSGPAAIVGTFVAKITGAGGRLLANRTKELIDDE